MPIRFRDKKPGAASGNLTLDCDSQSSWSQIAIKPNSGTTTGTLALKGVAWGNETPEVIYDQYGAPIVFNIAALRSMEITGSWEKFILEPSSLNGGYTANYVNFE